MQDIVALRFRDTDPRVDTIAVHRTLMREKNSVWWGWWRKVHEPDVEEQIRSIVPSTTRLYLVDPSTSRLFRCNYTTVKRKLGRKDLARVPSYYRAEVKRVSAWFLLTSIRDVSREFLTFPTLGQPTFYRLRKESSGPLLLTYPSPDPADAPTPESGLFAPEMIHASDLHFGADHAFQRPGRPRGIGEPVYLADALAGDVSRIKGGERPIVCLTGDLTTKGTWTNATIGEVVGGVVSLAKGLKVEPRDMLLIPGNHDMTRYDRDDPDYKDVKAFHNPAVDYVHEQPFRLVRQKTTGEDALRSLSVFRRYRTVDGFEIHVAGMNSCRITATEFSEYGWVGEDELVRILGLFKKLKDVNAVRVLALHHHVVPVAEIQRPERNGVTLTLDAGTLLRTVQAAGVQVVIHGHQHLPAISKFASAYYSNGSWTGLQEDVFVVGAGSAGSSSRRTDVPNSYTYLRFNEDHIDVRIRKLSTDGSESADLARLPLPVRPRSG